MTLTASTASKLPGLLLKVPAMQAKRINHAGARCPDPSLELLDQVARNMYLATCVQMGHDPKSWSECSQDTRDLYGSQARAAWATLALAGGAKVERVARPDDEDDLDA